MNWERKRKEKKKERQNNLFYHEPCAHVHQDTIGTRQLATDIERVGQRDQDRFRACLRCHLSFSFRSSGFCPFVPCGAWADDYGHGIPWLSAARLCTHRRHSLNLFWAPWSWPKEFVRCSSSSSSCFLTCASCWGSRVSRLTRCRAAVSAICTYPRQ